MRIRLMLALVALSLVVGRAAAADDVKAVLEKAVKAHGGEEVLTKYKAAKIKAKGSLTTMGVEIEFTVESSSQLPDRFREELKLDIMGNQLHVVQVFDGMKGWVSNMGMTMEVEGAQLDQLKDQAHFSNIESLVPLLKDKKFELKLLPEAKVEGKAAAGVQVSSKGHKDIKLFFDKESGLLVKTERKAMDPAMQEVNAETFYRDYKDVSGTKQAMKQSVKHDGKKFLEAEITEVKVFEKLDAATFAKP